MHLSPIGAIDFSSSRNIRTVVFRFLLVLYTYVMQAHIAAQHRQYAQSPIVRHCHSLYAIRRTNEKKNVSHMDF